MEEGKKGCGHCWLEKHRDGSPLGATGTQQARSGGNPCSSSHKEAELRRLVCQGLQRPHGCLAQCLEPACLGSIPWSLSLTTCEMGLC